MKEKLLKLSLVAILVLSIIATLGTAVFATEGQIEPRTVVEDGEDTDYIDETDEDAILYDVDDIYGDYEMPDIYEGDLYVIFGDENNYSGKYVMDKYVDGNVYIMGQDVEITGEVNGSLFVLAQSVKIEETAYVAIHTYVAAVDLEMNGFTSDMYAVSQNFYMGETAVINRDLHVAAVNANIYGTIGRDVKLSANSIDVYESEEQAMTVYGNFDCEYSEEIEDLDKVTIQGTTNLKETNEFENYENEDKGNSLSDYAFKAVRSIAFALIMYLLLVFLAPKFVEKSKDYVSGRGAIAGLIGLVFVILLPIIAFILILTLVGVYPAIVACLAYIVVLVMNSVIATIAISEYVASKFDNMTSLWKKLLIMVCVSLVIYLVELIPVLGSIISLILFFVGVGITVMYQFDKRFKKEEV